MNETGGDMRNDIHLPSSFSGTAQLILYLRYGDPRKPGWAQRWMTYWAVQKQFDWFPSTHLYLHQQFKIALEKAFKKIELLGLQYEIDQVVKCYQKEADSNNLLSVHAWGAGIDILPRNSFNPTAQWSDAFIQVIEEYQIWCGQMATHLTNKAHQFCMVLPERQPSNRIQ